MKPLQNLHPTDLLLAWFLALLAGLTLFFFHEIPKAGLLLAFYGVFFLLMFFLPVLTTGWRKENAFALRLILLCLGIPLIFSSLAFLVHHVSPDEHHWRLFVWDRRIFGGDVLRALNRAGTPMVTDLLYLAYVSYYFLPIALGWSLLRKRRFEDLEKTFVTIALGFFLSYLGYLLVPARSPNDVLPGLWQKTWLVGDIFSGWVKHSELLKRDAFPSGHFELTLVTLVLAWRMQRRVFWILLPFGVGLSAATVYLGYHFAVDLIAGGLLAVLVLWICDWMFKETR